MPGPSLAFLNWPTAVPGNFQRAHPPQLFHESVHYVTRTRFRPRFRLRLRLLGNAYAYAYEMDAVTRYYLPDALAAILVPGCLGYHHMSSMLLLPTHKRRGDGDGHAPDGDDSGDGGGDGLNPWWWVTCYVAAWLLVYALAFLLHGLLCRACKKSRASAAAQVGSAVS
ncbi:hypothetical protein SLS62_010921 [Diatrype stigma]|uniref:Uncharacterized protein n=1 Tax=Diatrype stigma TaxID=117547 RepID=A0AAN9YGZ1_9PEZI